MEATREGQPGMRSTVTEDAEGGVRLVGGGQLGDFVPIEVEAKGSTN